MHQVGDLHQPLHVVALDGPSWADGDGGGNNFFVRVREDRKPIDLHALWDGLLGSGGCWQVISNKATERRVAPEFDRKKRHEVRAKDVDVWVGESYRYARRLAYGNGSVVGTSDEKNGAVVLEWYTDVAKAVAERRVVRAGHRPAGLLQTTLGR